MRHRKKSSLDRRHNRSITQNTSSDLGLCKKLNSRVNKRYENNDPVIQLIPHNFRKSKRLCTMDYGKKLLKVSSFKQTDSEIHLELHLGRRVQPNEVQVTFTSDDVSVGLTSDGRTFHCIFPYTILEKQCKVQLKKVKLLLVLVKAETGLNWNGYEKGETIQSALTVKTRSAQKKKTVGASSQPNTTNDKDLNNASIFKTNLTKSKTKASSDTIKLINDCADANITDSPSGHVPEESVIVNCVKGDDGSNIKKDSDEYCSNSATLLSCSKKPGSKIYNSSKNNMDLINGNVTLVKEPQLHTVIVNKCDILTLENEVESKVILPGYNDLLGTSQEVNFCDEDDDFSVEGDLLLQCYSVDEKMEMEQENDISSTAQDLRVITDLKTDYTEMDINKLTVYLYIRGVDKESLQVNFSENDFTVDFSTVDEKFLKKQDATENTLFRFKLDLMHPIDAKCCTFTLRECSIEILLVKVTPAKWNGVNKLPFIQKGAANSPNIFDENSTPRFLSSVDKSQKNQRPTCMVSPLNVEIPTTSVPLVGPTFASNPFLNRPIGRVGLDNMGNTCFMNSIIQVLSNTVDLRDYFLYGCQMKELNTTNQLGMGGKLATAFAQLIKSLWTENSISVAPIKLKALIAQKQTRFIGYSQHDAEEFMEFLLDGLHEDLNRIIFKPYIANTVECSEGNVKEAADETWNRHKSRNDSMIVDLFQGQYHSKVKCPKCSKVSITFDPFSVVQVPIPNKNKKTIVVYFMPKQYSQKPCKYKFLIDSNGTVEHLIDLLRKHNPYLITSNIRVLEINKSKVVSVFERGSSFSRINFNDILACEVLSEENVGEPVVELLVEQRLMAPPVSPTVCSSCNKPANALTGVFLKRCLRCYRISYCGQECQKADWGRHKIVCNIEGIPVGWPFILSYPRSNIILNQLSQDADAFARYSVNVFCPPPTSHSLSSSSLDESPTDSSVPKGPIFDKLDQSFSPDLYEMLDRSSSNETIRPDRFNKFFGDDLVFEGSPCLANNLKISDESGGGDFTREVPTRCVLGQQQKPPQYKEASFQFRPINSSPCTSGSQFLPNTGDKALDLSGVQRLHMVWNNYEKSKNHVLVQSKQFDCDEKDTISQAINESKKKKVPTATLR